MPDPWATAPPKNREGDQYEVAKFIEGVQHRVQTAVAFCDATRGN